MKKRTGQRTDRRRCPDPRGRRAGGRARVRPADAGPFAARRRDVPAGGQRDWTTERETERI